MSKTFPLTVKKGSGKGRPRQEGDRDLRGDLLPRGPNPTLLARLREVAGDPTKAHSPLAAAYSNGWLSEEDHRAGVAYAMLYRQAGIGGPSQRSADYGEARSEEARALAGVRIRDMSATDIAMLWDEVFGETVPAGPEEREKREAAAMAKWRLINAELTADQRAELFAVCIMDSWPQWFCQRLAGRFGTSWERKRDLLTSGLARVREVLKMGSKGARATASDRPAGMRSFSDMRPLPAPARSNSVVEVVVCRDGAE